MEDNITKAMQTADLLCQDLKAIYSGALKNDALLILSGQLLEQAAKIRTVLSQL